MRSTSYPLLLLIVAVSFSALPALAQQRTAPIPAQREKPESMMSPQEKENKRIQELMEWRAKSHPTQLEYIRKLYEPVVAGCRKDYPRNLKMAEFYSDKAEKAQGANQAKNADAYAKAGEYYQALAKFNVQIVKALTENNGKDLDEAFAGILKLEGWIAQVTGKTVERDWFVPGEGAEQPAAPGAKPKAPLGTVK